MWCGIIFIVCSTILLLIFLPKILRWKSQGSDRSSAPSRFSTKPKWSQAQGNHASHAPPQSQQEGEFPAMNRVPMSVSEVETKHVKQVAFAGEESELIHRDKLLDKVKDLVLEKHNIDITSIILKITRADEAVAVTDEDDAQANQESTVVESA